MSVRKDAGKFLNEVVTPECRDCIPEESRRLIFDWFQLNEYFKETSPEEKFSDWSFLVLPMAKAIEGILFRIAEEIGLVHENANIGSYFDDNNIEARLNEIESKITKEELSKEQKEKIKTNLANLKSFLKLYRHEPLHNGQVIESFNRAEAYGKAALFTIGVVMNDLIQDGVISLQTNDVSDIYEESDIDPDDIPF